LKEAFFFAQASRSRYRITVPDAKGAARRAYAEREPTARTRVTGQSKEPREITHTRPKAAPHAQRPGRERGGEERGEERTSRTARTRAEGIKYDETTWRAKRTKGKVKVHMERGDGTASGPHGMKRAMEVGEKTMERTVNGEYEWRDGENRKRVRWRRDATGGRTPATP